MVSAVRETREEQSLAARYESLIRLADAVRQQHDAKELFRLLISELSQVVQFDAIAQFDEAANKVNWHLCDRCNQPGVGPPSDVAKEETLAWWVYEHQEAVALPLVEEETRFPATIQRLKELGIESVCALPLTTVHRRLGSLIIASEQPGRYMEEEEVRLYEHQEAVAIPLVEEETRFPATIQRLKELGIESVCALPLTTVHRIRTQSQAPS